MSFSWSPQQAKALDDAARWHSECRAELLNDSALSKPIFRLFGFAGTGKSTLARHLADQADTKTCYAAYTGKAAMVMRRNGCEGASTIHSAIYETTMDEDTGIASYIWDKDGPFSRAGLIVLDECSMIDAQIGAEVLAYGRPVLVLGDPAQLPPVRKDDGTGGGFFTEVEPDVMLTEIHRQAEGNPIIQLATAVREGRPLRAGQYGASAVIWRRDLREHHVMQADQLLVGKNATKDGYNAKIRKALGRKNNLPEIGERLVCIRNDKTKNILNGEIFEVVETGKTKAYANGEIYLTIKSIDDAEKGDVRVTCRAECFNGRLKDLPFQALRGTQQFDFGYALTVHKSQGSQWGNVVLLDESAAFRDDARRFLYTGITRAADKITICI